MRNRPRLLLAAVPTAVVALLLSGCDPRAAEPGAAGPTVLPIVSGTVADQASYPYYVEVTHPRPDGTVSLCGGSVIAPTWVLTAAHCVIDTVTVTNYHGDHEMGTTLVHPFWNGEGGDGHDLALVRVTGQTTAGITPVQVGDPAVDSFYAAGTWATTVGKGLTSGSAESDGVFRAAQVEIHSDDYMDDMFNRWYAPDYWQADLMIGAGDEDGARACHGDSGGPLLVPGAAGQPVEVGVASFEFYFPWEDGCERPLAYAELDGPQLAWLATVVPSVAERWSACTTTHGSPGHMRWTYGNTRELGPDRDTKVGLVAMSNYWNMICVSDSARVMRAKHSGLCAVVNPEGAPVRPRTLVQGACDGSLYTQFERVARPTGTWLVVAATGQCLAVHDGVITDRQIVVQAGCTAGDHRLWTLNRRRVPLTPAGGATYDIVNRKSSKCLDVENDYTGPGARIWQFPCDGGDNQGFIIIDISVQPVLPMPTLVNGG